MRKRSPCPIACTLDLVGDRWTMLVVRDLFCGKSQFKEFTASPEKIATNILADRLARLVTAKLVEKTPSAEHAGRETYRLTPRGRSLGPLVQAIAEWGLANIPGTRAHLKPHLD